MQFCRTLPIALIVAGMGWATASAAPCPPAGAQSSILAQAEYLGSEDYFRAHGGTPRDVVVALYADVLGRAPFLGEVDRWASRLETSSSAVLVARQFLMAAHSELAARARTEPRPMVVVPVPQQVVVMPPP